MQGPRTYHLNSMCSILEGLQNEKSVHFGCILLHPYLPLCIVSVFTTTYHLQHSHTRNLHELFRSTDSTHGLQPRYFVQATCVLRTGLPIYLPADSPSPPLGAVVTKT